MNQPRTRQRSFSEATHKPRRGTWQCSRREHSPAGAAEAASAFAARHSAASARRRSARRRPAIGARIKVGLNGPGGSREVHRVVGSGGSFGASPYRQEIGLGSAERIEFVEVRWPTADSQVRRYEKLQPGRFYELVEGTATARERTPKQFPWPAAGAAGHGDHGHP